MTPISNFIAPNNWAKWMPECGYSSLRIEAVSECYYEHVFDKYSEFMNEELIDRGPTQCEQDTVFDPMQNPAENPEFQQIL